MLKTLCAATIIALGSSAYAERVIVHHDANNNGLKKGHKVLAESKSWFAVDLDENGKSAIRGKKGFKHMEIDAKRYPMGFADSAGNPNSVQVTPYNYSQIQGDQLTYQGGISVCVIDSGIARETGDSGGGFNPDFDWSTITGDNDSGTGDWFRDGGAHGTHVAGTVGAADNGIGIIGVAPGVPMHIAKVFNAAGYGYSSDLSLAVERCQAAGANIINMSLGGGPSVQAEINAMEAFRDAGGLLVAAAGNDGNTTRSNPAGYTAVMMIGGVNRDDAASTLKRTSSGFPRRGTKARPVNENDLLLALSKVKKTGESAQDFHAKEFVRGRDERQSIAAKVNGNSKGANTVDLQNLMAMTMKSAASMNNNSSDEQQDAAELADDDEVPNIL